VATVAAFTGLMTVDLGQSIRFFGICRLRLLRFRSCLSGKPAKANSGHRDYFILVDHSQRKLALHCVFETR
jgi:hypothetical protein